MRKSVFVILAAGVAVAAGDLNLNADLHDDFEPEVPTVAAAGLGDSAPGSNPSAAASASASAAQPTAAAFDDDEEFVGGGTAASSSSGGKRSKNTAGSSSQDNAGKKAKTKRGKLGRKRSAAAGRRADADGGASGSSSSQKMSGSHGATTTNTAAAAGAPGRPVPLPLPSLTRFLAGPDGRVMGTLPVNMLFDFLAGLLAAFFVVNYFVGKSRNRSLAEKWRGQVGPLIESQFAQVGFPAPAGTEGRDLLAMESASEFKYYATGRVRCQSLLVKLDLSPRQDLASAAIDLFFPSPDAVNYRIGAHTSVVPMFTLAVFKATKKDAVLEKHPDIAEGCSDHTGLLGPVLCPQSKDDDVNLRGLVLMTDCPEAAAEFLASPPVASSLAACADTLTFLHVTDRHRDPHDPEGKVHPAIIQVTTLLGKSADETSGLRLALGALDTCPRLSPIRGAVAQRVTESRTAAQRGREKEELRRVAEEARERLAEEREREARERRMDAARQGPEALARFEEKEKARLAKRRQPKMKMLKG